MDRRSFLNAIAAGFAATTLEPERKPFGGQILGASHHHGHLLRDGGLQLNEEPAQEQKADIVVVGGGVCGISAAWRFAPSGLDIHVIELEPSPGGTSAYGEDGACPHPWGAHYLAAPNPEARAALRLLSDMGTVTGWDAASRPIFDRRVLCHSPQERIFYQGEWHENLVPLDALTDAERDELDRFHDTEEKLTEQLGNDGRPAFQIPIEFSSRDPSLLALDRITMHEWLVQQGYKTPFLHWYVRYATLDDFGADTHQVSAWAGLHYFAARKLKTPELSGSHFLVWPEGNGRLVRAMLEQAKPKIHTRTLVTGIEASGQEILVRAWDLHQRISLRFRARGVLIATPAFVAKRLLPHPLHTHLPTRIASPWLVANLHVRRQPNPNLPWDSVLFDAQGLGYVHAGHQQTRLEPRTVLTYYRAFGDADVAHVRQTLARAPWQSLAGDVLSDLAPAHPHLREEIERMDFMLWGHGMPRPTPGFIGDPPFESPSLLAPGIAYGHVDQSGMAIFEEAQSRGVRAAEALAQSIGVRLGETWL